MKSRKIRRLYGRVAGRASQPTVVLLHGFMGSGQDWDKVISGLIPDYRCVTIDLPGHGRSVGLTESGMYSWSGCTRRIEQTLKSLRITRCAMVGYSMGGRMALHYALRHPARVSQLVLESASPGLKTAALRRARQRADAKLAGELERYSFAVFLRNWYRQPLFTSLAARPRLLRAVLRKRLRNNPTALARALRGLGAGRQPPAWAALGRLRPATLAMAGQHDLKFRGIIREMRRHCPRMETAVIHGAGHAAHVENADRFIQVLKTFLQKDKD